MADWSNALIEMSVPLETGIAGGWSNPLAEMSVLLLEGRISGWSDPLAQMSMALEPSEIIVSGWKRVSQMTVDLLPPIMCSTNADCPEGYVCENGVCVKKEGAFPWTWLAIGSAAAGVILIASGIAKKRKRA